MAANDLNVGYGNPHGPTSAPQRVPWIPKYFLLAPIAIPIDLGFPPPSCGLFFEHIRLPQTYSKPPDQNAYICSLFNCSPTRPTNFCPFSVFFFPPMIRSPLFAPQNVLLMASGIFDHMFTPRHWGVSLVFNEGNGVFSWFFKF